MWFQTQCQRRKCKSGHIKFWLTQACPYFNKLLPLFLIFLAKYKGMGGFSWLLHTVHATIVVIVWVNYCRSHCTLTVPCSQKRSVLYCHFFLFILYANLYFLNRTNSKVRMNSRQHVELEASICSHLIHLCWNQALTSAHFVSLVPVFTRSYFSFPEYF